MKIEFKSIGTLHTPYLPSLPIPHQPPNDAQGEFWITLQPEYIEGLDKLLTYRYITLLYYLDQAKLDSPLKIHPSWAPEIEVGVFASRSPHRPNPIGFSIVELKGIEGNEILISGVDVYNGTPLLDIKPYIHVIDVKQDANDGWYETLQDKDHVISHLLGLSHKHNSNFENGHGDAHNHPYEHENGHSHAHSHGHSHNHDHTDIIDHSSHPKVPVRRTLKGQIIKK